MGPFKLANLLADALVDDWVVEKDHPDYYLEYIGSISSLKEKSILLEIKKFIEQIELPKNIFSINVSSDNISYQYITIKSIELRKHKQREYHKDNNEKINIRKRKYYLNNREEILDIQKNTRDKEQKSNYNKEWYKRNIEEILRKAKEKYDDKKK